MGIDLRQEYSYCLLTATSMGVRLTPVGGQPVHSSDTFMMQATSAESNVMSISSYLGLPVKVLTTFVKGSPIARFIQDNLAGRHIAYEGKEVEQGGPWGYRHQFNIADSGQGSPTCLTVGDVRRLHDADPSRLDTLFARIGEIVRAARRAIESGTPDSLGPLMNENHALLRELTVSSGLLDRLCQAARDAGARGAKLSGGGRGGNIIALVDEPDAAPVTAALLRAGAVRVLSTRIEQSP